MSGYVVPETNDRADEAYDAARQEEVDNVTIVYPSPDTLTARGKYATLASERRDILRTIREGCEAIASYAGRTLRTPDDTGFIGLQIESMRNAVERIRPMHARLAVVQLALNELKPSAWGEKNGD